MKYLFIFLFLCTSSFSQIKLDLKSKFSEKSEISAVKNGALLFLKKLGDYQIVEFGEDYSVWFSSYSATLANDTIFISYSIDLRTPAAISPGKIVKTQSVSVEYPVNKVLDGTELELVQELVNLYDKNLTSQLKNNEWVLEAFYTGQKSAEIISIMLGSQK